MASTLGGEGTLSELRDFDYSRDGFGGGDIDSTGGNDFGLLDGPVWEGDIIRLADSAVFVRKED